MTEHDPLAIPLQAASPSIDVAAMWQQVFDAVRVTNAAARPARMEASADPAARRHLDNVASNQPAVAEGDSTKTSVEALRSTSLHALDSGPTSFSRPPSGQPVVATVVSTSDRERHQLSMQALVSAENLPDVYKQEQVNAQLPSEPQQTADLLRLPNRPLAAKASEVISEINASSGLDRKDASAQDMADESVAVHREGDGIAIVLRNLNLSPELAIKCALETALHLDGARRSLQKVILNGLTVYEHDGGPDPTGDAAGAVGLVFAC